MNVRCLLFALVFSVSASANALSVVAERTSHTGVITAVDTEAASVTVRDGSGSERRLQLRDDTRLRLNDRAVGCLSELQTGQKVNFTIKTLSPITEALEGVVLKVDKKRKTALIRPVNGGETVEVQFEGVVKMRGIQAVSALSDLRPGHVVTLREI